MSDIGRRAWNSRFEVRVANDGAMYLLRGVKPYWGDPEAGHATQEMLYLERHRAADERMAGINGGKRGEGQ